MLGKRYEAVQRCCGLLRLSDVSQRDKLRLEFQLMQVKRLLLKDHNLRNCRHKQCNQGAFDNLENMLRQLTETDMPGSTLELVSQELEEMLVVLWALDKAYANYSLSF